MTCPHPQVRAIIRYSVTCTAICGISKTCTAEAILPGVPASPPPHPPQADGSTRSFRPGTATRSKPVPRWPFCPPADRLPAARDVGGFTAFAVAFEAGPS